jgi:3-oxoacyl-[acyl-carrier protein] reductase
MTRPRRNAIVTGGSRGVGLAITRALVRSGWNVWNLSTSPHPDADDSRLHHLRCDLRDRASLDVALSTCLEQIGRVDAVIANAAHRGFGSVGDLDAMEWDDAIAVNLTSAVLLVRRTLPALRLSRGQVVLMGSHASDRHFEEGAAYCASKAGLKAFAEVLSLEERPRGVRTSLVSPGAIANEPGDESLQKISLRTIGTVVRTLLDLPEDAVIGELEIRPSRLLPGPVTGLDRLQAV